MCTTVDKACKVVFAIFPRFLKDLFQSEDLIRGAAIQDNCHKLFLAN